jgi:hypothetical protein
MFGQTADKALFDSLIESLSAKLDAYEVILAKHKYLAGNVCPCVPYLLGTFLNHIISSPGSDPRGSVPSSLCYYAGAGWKPNHDHQGSECHQVCAGLVFQ